jgi:hypothetical protein
LRHQFPHCDRTLQLLLKTFIDIVLLRQGPEKLPRSWMLFFVVLLISVLVSILASEIVLADTFPMHDVTLLLALLNVGFYFVVLHVSGYPERFLQCAIAILGADALLTVSYLGGFLAIELVADRATAFSLAWFVSCWSVSVEGHIIARAIERHWVVGIAIALASYILLLLTYWQMVGIP